MDEFDKRHRRQQNLVGAGVTAFGLVWLLSALFSLAVMAGLAYVAWHFISKFW